MPLPENLWVATEPRFDNNNTYLHQPYKVGLKWLHIDLTPEKRIPWEVI